MTALSLSLCKKLCEKHPEKFKLRHIGNETFFEWDDYYIRFYDGILDKETDQDSCDRLCAELGRRFLLWFNCSTGTLWADILDAEWRILVTNEADECIDTNESEKTPASIAATAEIIRRVVE